MSKHEPVLRPTPEGARVEVSYKGHVLMGRDGLWACVHCGRTCRDIIELSTCRK